MTKDEIIAELAKHEELVPSETPDTFLRHDESFDNLHMFFRVIADDVVFESSVMKASSVQARSTALKVLDLAQRSYEEIANRMTTKLSGLDSDFPQFDHLVAIGPGRSTSPPIKGARYLIPVTTKCGPINKCEFVGDEEVVEVRARLMKVLISDITRAVEPVVNERHRFDNGVKSKQKFLGVARQRDLIRHVEKLPKLGGVVEMENFERIGCVVVGQQGQDTLELNVEGQTRKASLEQALSFFDTFLTQGAEAGMKEL